MAYTTDRSALRMAPRKAEKRQNVAVHIWNKLAAPMKRRITDSETTYQPTAKPDAERAAKIANMGRVPEIPAMSPEQIAFQKRQQDGAQKLRAEYDAGVARNQAIADSYKKLRGGK